MGFAYEYGPTGPKGLLANKKVLGLTTMGASLDVYEKIGMIKSMDQIMAQGTFEFCGMQVMAHHYFGNISHDQEERKKVLEEVRRIAESFN